MSHRALLLATRDELREHLIINGKRLEDVHCECMVDGRPMPMSGEYFISVHPGGVRGTNPEVLLAVHQINITVTLRSSYSPFDKTGTRMTTYEKEGIEDISQKIIEIVHMNYHLVNKANNYIKKEPPIVLNTVNRFIEPLRFQFYSAARLAGGDWFHAQAHPESALIQAISFGEALRAQYPDFQPTITRLARVPFPSGIL